MSPEIFATEFNSILGFLVNSWSTDRSPYLSFHSWARLVVFVLDYTEARDHPSLEFLELTSSIILGEERSGLLIPRVTL